MAKKRKNDTRLDPFATAVGSQSAGNTWQNAEPFRLYRCASNCDEQR